MKSSTHRHPAVFWYLCNIAFWDGYFYFALITLLVVYLVQTFGLTDQRAYALYGIFLSVGYTMPLLAGWISDHLIGSARAIIYGNVFIMIGCILLALPHSVRELFAILFLISFGVGLIKVNTNSLLAKIYQDGSMAREHGYTLLYGAMNVGAILGPILVSWIAGQYGWSWAFLVSAVFFAASLVLYLTQYRYIHAQELVHLKLSWKVPVPLQVVLMIVGTVCLVAILTLLVIVPHLFSVFIALIIILAVHAFYVEWRKAPATAWKGLLLLLVLYVFMMLFFIGEFQVGGALALFVTRQIGTFHFWNFSIPAQSSSALLPLFVAVGALLMNPLMSKFNKQSVSSRLLWRIFLGAVLAVLSFLFFFGSAQGSAMMHMGVMIAGLVLGYLFLGLAEILIAPTAIIATGHAIAKERQGTFMGAYYLFAALSGYLAGKVSSVSQISAANITDHALMGAVYSKTFLSLMIMMLVMAVVAGLILLGIKLCHPVRLKGKS